MEPQETLRDFAAAHFSDSSLPPSKQPILLHQKVQEDLGRDADSRNQARMVYLDMSYNVTPPTGRGKFSGNRARTVVASDSPSIPVSPFTTPKLYAAVMEYLKSVQRVCGWGDELPPDLVVGLVETPSSEKTPQCIHLDSLHPSLAFVFPLTEGDTVTEFVQFPPKWKYTSPCEYRWNFLQRLEKWEWESLPLHPLKRLLPGSAVCFITMIPHRGPKFERAAGFDQNSSRLVLFLSTPLTGKAAEEFRSDEALVVTEEMFREYVSGWEWDCVV